MWLNFICVRPFSHKAKFCLFCKQICQQEVISSAKDFFTTKIFSTVTKVQRCHWENLEAHNVLSGDNLLFFLTAILCQVILFCRHDLRRKTLLVSDASKVAKTKNCCEPNSVFCHSANKALVQWCSMTKSFINPSLGNFAKKCVLNLVKSFSGHFRAIKSQNLL